jgi:tetratricopeptide (TPR) repeat protein
MSPDEFARRLKRLSEHPDSRFAFFLGAGCSVSSGIPAARDLVRSHWAPRLLELCDMQAEAGKQDEIVQTLIPEYDPENPALSYGAVIERLFLHDEERQREIESLCDNRFPGFGYVTLAMLMTLDKSQFNVAITTNFDDLIAMAIESFTPIRPNVVQLESLSNYIRATRTRPLIIKLHGDHRLAPLNTLMDVTPFEKDVEKRVRAVIRDRGLIFIGYGGNDERVVEMLSMLSDEALPLGIYWISDSEPQGVIREWLIERKAIWTPHSDFDELMLLVRDQFDLPHPDGARFNRIFEQYSSGYNDLSNRIRLMTGESNAESALKQAVQHVDRSFPDFWSVEMAASRTKHSDLAQTDQIYLDGLRLFPESVELMTYFANYLRDFRKDYNRAEECYRKAIATNAQYAPGLLNFALFLTWVRKDQDRAEEFYLRAIKADPVNARIVTTYANFLAKIRNDVKKASEYFQKALEMDSSDANIQLGFAGFLLALGEKDRGLGILERLREQAKPDQGPGLALEYGFYQLAHAEPERREAALKLLKTALKTGGRRPGLMLKANIRRAEREGFPEPSWLQKLAMVINDEANINVLEEWLAWKRIVA